LIDHNTLSGFESVAEAREYLLRAGRKELSSGIDSSDSAYVPQGCHVVAPCPHDGACPLLHAGSQRLVCGFSQRLQRPTFVRKTKHSGVGHEDVGYSYVVIRRGPRPDTLPVDAPIIGRLGAVGKREVEKEMLKAEEAARPPMHELVESRSDDAHHDPMLYRRAQHAPVESSTEPSTMRKDALEVQETLRQEAYTWPRLVFPPLKRSGHVIIDVCHPNSESGPLVSVFRTKF
jgi:ribosomal protein RSM22 (predicted rRNA methylase)